MVKKKQRKQKSSFGLALIAIFVSLVVLNAFDDIFTEIIYSFLGSNFNLIDPLMQKIAVAVIGSVLLFLIYRFYLDKKIKGKFSFRNFLLRK